MEKYIGIDVGGGSIRAAVIDINGHLYAEVSTPTHSTWNNSEFLKEIDNLLVQIMPKFTIKSIGIGTPGPIDIDNGTILHSANLLYLKNVPLVNHIEDTFKTKVFFNNDANCAALGEYYFGMGQKTDNLIVLTLGTGLGCGWIYKGILFNGYNGSGMEAGHSTIVKDGAVCGCGQKGCAESYFSARGFLNRYEEQTGERPKSAKEFFTRVEQKDPTAIQILNYGTEVLAELIRTLVHLVNPNKIILVGGLTKSYSLYSDTLNSCLDSIIFPSLRKILSIEIGGSVSGTYGAASLGFKG